MLRDHTPLPVIVKADGTFDVGNANAVAFSLYPMSGRRAFPVLVYVDDSLEPLRVDSPDAFRQPAAFKSLRVDTRPAGGRKDDRWRVVLYPSHDDLPVARTLRSSTGAVLSARAPSVLLFDIDSRKDPTPFLAVSTYPGPYSVDPRNPTLLTLADGDFTSPAPSDMSGPAWDVSDFSRVLLCMEQWSADGTSPHAMSIGGMLAGAASTTGRNLFSLYTADFGIDWDGTTASCTAMGGPTAFSTTAYKEDIRRTPAARFYLTTDGAEPMPAALNNKNLFWMRLYAVGMC